MNYQIATEAELREITGGPVDPLVLAKSSPALTAPLKRFIALSPFACIATHAKDGSSDVSPRGDAPGFAKLLDDRTLVLPERPGNRRLDSVLNIINQPRLALLFVIPGVLDTVRVNGRGIVTNDPKLLSQFEVNGKRPQLAIVVTIEEAFGHCSKAFRRSKLWQADYVPTDGVPNLAEMMGAHLALDAKTQSALSRDIEDDAQNNMY